jgi:hypothetical protein
VGSTGGTEFDVEGSDTDFLATGGNVLSGQHGGVGRAFVTIGLHFHTTSNTGNGFTAREIGDMDEGIVE